MQIMQKKQFAITLALIITLYAFSGCAVGSDPQDNPGGGKITVITTLFPQYDFTRQIAGDRAEVIMLLPPGAESHVYEPTQADIIKIEKADLFIYTGRHMEPWTARIVDGLDGAVLVADISENITLYKSHEDEHGDGHEYNPHFWTSPVLAGIMVDSITNALCEADPDGSDYYKANALEYKLELDGLDQEIRQMVAESKRNKAIFAGKFAFHYFFEQYGLEHEAAFDSCAAEAEPSVKRILQLIDSIKNEGIPVIYYEELANPGVAQTISEETGAKPLLLHSCHNVTLEEFDSGVTYLDLMYQNLKNLKEGLN